MIKNFQHSALDNLNGSYGFYGVHIRALIVKIQEYTIRCNVLQHSVFTIKTMELWHVSTLSCKSSSGNVHAFTPLLMFSPWGW
jgi:hypothetical protein